MIKKIIFSSVAFLGLSGFCMMTSPECARAESVQIVSENMSAPMTYDEMIADYASYNGISIEEATKHFAPNIDLRNGDRKTYRSFGRDLSDYWSGSFKPTIRFYCETTESKWNIAIMKVLKVSMNASGKIFKGSVYYNLERPSTIFYIVNGDFYNTGETTFTAGITVNVGEAATMNFGVSYASGHYKHIYYENRYILH